MRRTPRGGSGTGHGQIAQAELLKLQKTGQFPDDPVRIKGSPIHCVNSHVLGISVIICEVVVYFEPNKTKVKTRG